MESTAWEKSKEQSTEIPDNQIITFSKHQLRWKCLIGYQNRLFSGQAPDWLNLDGDARAERIKKNPVRQIYRLNLSDTEVFVKVYKPVSRRDRLKDYMRSSPAGLEFKNMQRARLSSVPTARPLAWAEGGPKGKPCHILITESLGKVTALEEFIWREPPCSDRELSVALDPAAQTIALLHRAGIYHRDLHLGNILIKNHTQAYIIDLQKLHRKRSILHSASTNYHHWQTANLAMLMHPFRLRLTKKQIHRFVLTYLRSLNKYHQWSPSEINQFEQRLQYETDRYIRRFLTRRDRRCLENTKYARKIKLPGNWTARVFLQTKHPYPNNPASYHHFPPHNWQEALAKPEKLLQSDNYLKQGEYNTVTTQSLTVGSATIEVVIKHTRLRKGIRGLIQSLRVSRAVGQWHKAHMLINRHLPTAWPLAALEHRQGLMLRESILICEKIYPSYNLSEFVEQTSFPQNPAVRIQLALELGRLLADLRRWGFRHRDCKATNIIVHHRPDEPSPYRLSLVDLDGVSLRRLPFFGVRHEALVRLAASALTRTQLKQSDYVRVFKAYLTRQGREANMVLWSLAPLSGFFYLFAQDFIGKKLKELNRPVYDHRPTRKKLWKTISRQAQKKAQKSSALIPVTKNFRKILIIKPSSLGDVVRCLPILAGLRWRYPHAQISWLVRPDIAPLLKTVPGLDEIIEFDRKHYGKIGRHYSATRDFIAFLHQLRCRRFEMVLDLQGLFRSGFISLITGAPVRFGFTHAREFAAYFYTHRIKIPPQREHVVESYWRFAQPLGFYHLDKQFQLPLDPQDRESARQILGQEQLNENQDYLVLLIGGTKPEKCWPPSRFAALAQVVNNRYDMATVLLGAGQPELDLARQVVQQGKAKIINLVNQTSLPQLMAIIKEARLVVGNDSGPLHIAAALQCPVVGLYGPTDPFVVGPYEQLDSIVLTGETEPRSRRYSNLAQHRIENITVEQVINAIDKRLNYIPKKE